MKENTISPKQGAPDSFRGERAYVEYDSLVSEAKELISKALGARPRSEDLAAWARFLNEADKEKVLNDPDRTAAISAAAKELESATEIAAENHFDSSCVKATALLSFAAYCAVMEFADAIWVGKIYSCALPETVSLEKELANAER